MRTTLLVLALSTAACPKPERPLDPQPPVTLRGGLVSQVLRPGDGDPAKKGDKITVHFVGTLLDGSVFDSSRERRQSFSFWVGEGQVIRGWDEGLLGVKEGTLLKLTVPPTLGYGSDAKPKIPPNSTLVFEIELLNVR